nr:immunoglobulin light chain junction region [Macaca mulatta]
CQQNAHWPRTF